MIPVNPFWTKTITAENLYVNGDAAISGNVYVSGDLNLDGDNIEPDFTGKLSVKGDINLNGDNSTINVSDVYANNILLYGSGAKLVANCSSLKDAVGSGSGIFVKDDLEINESNQEVTINGSYYGFSDGSNYPTPDHSSGININTYDTGDIDVTVVGDVYLQGTSYVNVVNSDNRKYQTGESVSIKGNYRAYMQPLIDTTITPEYLREDNINFSEYDEYLRLADSFVSDGTTLTAMDKASYLYYYNEEYSGLGLNLSPNLNLAASGSIYSIGSTISNGILNFPYYTIDDTDIYNEAEEVYNVETQKLGDDGASLTSDEEDGDGLEFDTQVNYSSLVDNIDINDGSKIVYINNNSDDVYNLTSGTYEGLIVTNGNIKISGEVNFTGSIICGGDVIIEDSTSKTFSYDKGVVSRIIAEYDLHKTVFKSDTSSESPINITTFVTGYVDGDETVNVDFSNLLKFNDWQIN
jgi:cytoskeletal protein CcmA (bactofilin family)